MYDRILTKLNNFAKKDMVGEDISDSPIFYVMVESDFELWFNRVCFSESSVTHLSSVIATLTMLTIGSICDNIKAIAMASKATYNRVLKTLMVEFEKEDVKSREQVIEIATSIADNIIMGICNYEHR